MLMPRTTHDAIGGHEAVKATLNEDMHMARLVKAAGLRLRVIQGGGLYRVRMYAGLKQIWRGWSRIFFGCFGTFPRLLVSVIMLSVFSLSPYMTLLASVAASGTWPWLPAAAIFAIVGQQSVLWRFYGVTGNRPAWAISYALGAALCLGMTLNAMRRLGGGHDDDLAGDDLHRRGPNNVPNPRYSTKHGERPPVIAETANGAP